MRKLSWKSCLAALVVVVAFALGIAAVAGQGGSSRRSVNVAASAAAAPSTDAQPDVVNGVDQTLLQECIADGSPGACPDKVPGLRECMAQGLICNAAAGKELETAPLAAVPTGKTLSEAAAIAIARRIAQTPLTPEAPDSVPAYAKLVTYRDVLDATNGSASAVTDTSRLVWVVTVVAPIATDGSPARAAEVKSAYTAVLDAETGKAIDICIGCNTLAPNGK
jgi:hypothetical protein